MDRERLPMATLVPAHA